MNITINIAKEEALKTLLQITLKTLLQITDEELSREDSCQEYIDDLTVLKITLNKVIKHVN